MCATFNQVWAFQQKTPGLGYCTVLLVGLYAVGLAWSFKLCVLCCWRCHVCNRCFYVPHACLVSCVTQRPNLEEHAFREASQETKDLIDIAESRRVVQSPSIARVRRREMMICVEIVVRRRPVARIPTPTPAVNGRPHADLARTGLLLHQLDAMDGARRTRTPERCDLTPQPPRTAMLD